MRHLTTSKTLLKLSYSSNCDEFRRDQLLQVMEKGIKTPFSFKRFLTAVPLIIATIMGRSTALQIGTATPDQKLSLPSKSVSALSLTISATEAVVPSGSPVKVNIIMANTSDHQMLLWVMDAAERAGKVYRADVWDDNGDTLPDTRMNRILKYNLAGCSNPCPKILGGHGDYLALKPGETSSDQIDLTKLYDFSQPGRYHVQVERAGEDNKTWIKSNTITVTVEPSGRNQPIQLDAPGSALLPTFSISIRTATGNAAIVKVGSAVALNVVTTNTTGHNIVLWAEKADREQAGVTYRVDVSDINGKPLPDTPLGRQVKNRTDIPNENHPTAFAGPTGEKLVLQPGESWPDTIILNSLYDFKQPGIYTIQVERFDSVSGTMVTSNAVAVTIAP